MAAGGFLFVKPASFNLDFLHLSTFHIQPK